MALHATQSCQVCVPTINNGGAQHEHEVHIAGPKTNEVQYNLQHNWRYLQSSVAIHLFYSHFTGTSGQIQEASPGRKHDRTWSKALQSHLPTITASDTLH